MSETQLPLEPFNFFPECVHRGSTTQYKIACLNNAAKLFMQPCSKRCTENVTEEEYARKTDELSMKVAILYHKQLDELRQREEESKQREEKPVVNDEKRSIDEVCGGGSQDVAKSERLGREPMVEILNGASDETVVHPAEADAIGSHLLGEHPKASPTNLTVRDISSEKWRAYKWTCPQSGIVTVHTVVNPAKVAFYKGCTTHRVLDSDGVAHCVPAPGIYGCVLTWLGGIAW